LYFSPITQQLFEELGQDSSEYGGKVTAFVRSFDATMAAVAEGFGESFKGLQDMLGSEYHAKVLPAAVGWDSDALRAILAHAETKSKVQMLKDARAKVCDEIVEAECLVPYKMGVGCTENCKISLSNIMERFHSGKES
jgi:hypothetical protein